MKPQKIWANFGVRDLERTTKFYTALGFSPNGPNNSTEIRSFLFGKDDFIIHFFIMDRFKNDINGKVAEVIDGNEVIFSLSAESEQEVDEWVDKVKQAGGKIFKEPTKFEIGYFVGFLDPDGHKFNVLYWPKK